MNALRLSEKDPAETVPVSWDFKEDIAEGMTLSTATIGIVVDRSLRRNNDSNPAAMLSGDSVIEGSVVLQAVSGGVDGVDYKIVCTVEIDSEPRTVLRKSSVLPVRNQ